MAFEDWVDKPRVSHETRKRIGCAGGIVAFSGFVLFMANMRANWSFVITVGSAGLMVLGTAVAFVAAVTAITDGVAGPTSSSCLAPLGAAIAGVVLLALILGMLALLGRQ